MYQLNFIKIIKKTLQKNLVKDIKVSLKKMKREQHGHEHYKNPPKYENKLLVECRKHALLQL